MRFFVVERSRGQVLAKQPGKGSTGVLQVVWRILYDDKDVEQMTRTVIIAAMNVYRLHAHRDPVGENNQRNLPVLAENFDEDPEDGSVTHGVFDSATDFLLI